MQTINTKTLLDVRKSNEKLRLPVTQSHKCWKQNRCQ